MIAIAHNSLRRPLLNDWQRGFPLVERPFAAVAAELGCSEDAVITQFRSLRAAGALSRIGAVFAAGAGGAGLLAAMAVPRQALGAVAAIVSAHPAVNHNYEREHAWNLWFVVNGADAASVEHTLASLEAATGCRALRLRMQRAYRIDLGFDLNGRIGQRDAGADGAATRAECAAPLAPAEWPLAALAEQGLALEPRPYARWARELGIGGDSGQVCATLARWLREGTLKRFGVVVRHHELGFDANAMTVFDVPDTEVDTCGAALACEGSVSLAYRRERADGWPYNLYCMLHGRDRAAVRTALAGVMQRTGLQPFAHEVLFSCRRFKQVGGRRFRALDAAACHAL